MKLEVPENDVGLEGKTLNGMALTLYGGQAWWDKAGKAGFWDNNLKREDLERYLDRDDTLGFRKQTASDDVLGWILREI